MARIQVVAQGVLYKTGPMILSSIFLTDCILESLGILGSPQTWGEFPTVIFVKDYSCSFV